MCHLALVIDIMFMRFIHEVCLTVVLFSFFIVFNCNTKGLSKPLLLDKFWNIIKNLLYTCLFIHM